MRLPYRCLDCGAIFFKPGYFEERQYHGEVGCTERFGRSCCPDCGSEEIEEYSEKENEE